MSDEVVLQVTCDGCKAGFAFPLLRGVVNAKDARELGRRALAKQGWQSRTRLGKHYDACPACLARLNDPSFGERLALPAPAIAPRSIGGAA